MKFSELLYIKSSLVLTTTTKKKGSIGVIFFPSRDLLVQNQQWKHQNNESKLFKVSNNDIRTMLMTQTNPSKVGFMRVSTKDLNFFICILIQKNAFDKNILRTL